MKKDASVTAITHSSIGHYFKDSGPAVSTLSEQVYDANFWADNYAPPSATTSFLQDWFITFQRQVRRQSLKKKLWTLAALAVLLAGGTLFVQAYLMN